ncbi:MAG: arginyl-tRNA synthetase [Solirubrobacteraceae bacterium]|jgi:arginyl-tRNA synthetase|nr:arginyl-tRNA synthetase [Solirubrobacteraceae bacterium]
MTAVDDLRAAVLRAAASLGAEPKSPPTLERPRQAEHGDYATNAAMLLAGQLKAPPREIAERLATAIAEELGPALDRAEVAGPGFLNLFLTDAWHGEALQGVLSAGEDFGAGHPEAPEKVLVEFVSANPTGPLTAASGRHAAFGDALRSLLRFAGHEVDGEYYFNDAGSQVDKLGLSIQARARGEEPPEDGYQGDYVAELAGQIPDAATTDVSEVARKGVELMFARIRATLAAYRVEFESYFSERELFEGDPDAIHRAYARLEARGLLFHSEGALWLRTTDFGDDKDRVLERSTGAATYFASDVAYHERKLERGYDRMINVLGADHHGYIKRMKAAMAALGVDPDRLEIPMLQFVHVVEGGERASMSKRRGDFVTLDELIGEIGVDATRWFMLARSHDSTVDLDLDLARRQSAENPVYYVQYAHARIASIRRRSQAEPAIDPSTALHPSERQLVKALLEFPLEAQDAADRRAPHRITTYALELAQVFTAFYRDCPIVGAPEEANRLALAVATQRTLARSLDLLGITAPEEM